MQPVSSRFLPALAQSHISVVKAVVAPNTVNATTLMVTGGKVTADKTAAYRRVCQFTVEDQTGAVTPPDLSGLLAPNGNEVQLWRGVQYSDGSQELISLGVFGISEVDVEDDGAGGVILTVNGYDRGRTISRRAWTDVYTVPAGLTYDVAIRQLIESRFPAGSGYTYLFTPQTQVTPASPQYTFANQGSNNDPWQAAQTLAAAAGCVLYFDPNGNLVLAAASASTTNTSVMTYGTGSGAITIKRALINEGVYNDVVVIAASTTASPVRGETQDTNPASPTYVAGAYGDIPLVISTSAISLQADAQTMSAAQLQLAAGLSDTITMTTVPNAALDIDDVVTLNRANIHLAGNYVIQAFDIYLDTATASTSTLRKQQVTASTVPITVGVGGGTVQGTAVGVQRGLGGASATGSGISINETVTGSATSGTTVQATFTQPPKATETIIACLGSCEGTGWVGPSTGPPFAVVQQSATAATCAILAATGDGNTASFTFTTTGGGGTEGLCLVLMRVSGLAGPSVFELNTSITATSTGGTNLLSANDSDFETGIGTWQNNENVASLTSSTDHAKTGTHSLKVVPTTGGSDMIAQTGLYAATPGTTYAASAWVFSPTPGGAQTAVNLQWWTATSGGTFVSNTTGVAVAESSSAFVNPTVSGAAPIGANAVSVYVYMPGAGNGTVGSPADQYIDDVTLTGPGGASQTSAAFTPGTSTQPQELWVAAVSPASNSLWTPTAPAYTNGFTTTMVTAASLAAFRWDALLVGTKLAGATGSAATTASWTSSAQRYDGEFAAFKTTGTITGASGVNTITQVTNSMILAGQDQLYGVPTYYSWCYGPENDLPTPDPNKTTATFWGQLGFGHTGWGTDSNTAVQIGQVELYCFSASQQKWFVCMQANNSGSIQGAWFRANFFNNISTTPLYWDALTGAAGRLSSGGAPSNYVGNSSGGIVATLPHTLVYNAADNLSFRGDGYEPYIFHFYGVNRAFYPIPRADIQAWFATLQARLVLINSGGTDDRSSANFTINVGGDVWIDQTSYFNFTGTTGNNNQIFEGRFMTVPNTGGWVAANAYNGPAGSPAFVGSWPNATAHSTGGLTAAQITANPPPLNALAP